MRRSPHIRDLDSVQREVWKFLEEGTTGSRSDFHLASLATVRHGIPQVRTVVLREIVREERILRIHSDIRSPKIDEIRADGRVAVLFYSAQRKTQIRITANASIHHDDALAHGSWNRTPLPSRRPYLAPHPPGTVTAEPCINLPGFAEGRHPTHEESEAGYANFCVIDCRIGSFEWLQLFSQGHLRARFEWSGTEFAGSWIAP